MDRSAPIVQWSTEPPGPPEPSDPAAGLARLIAADAFAYAAGRPDRPVLLRTIGRRLDLDDDALLQQAIAYGIAAQWFTVDGPRGRRHVLLTEKAWAHLRPAIDRGQFANSAHNGLTKTPRTAQARARRVRLHSCRF